MRIGIFGGTFDPPHIGHLILAAEAQFQLGLDQILWVLTPYPPHKQGHNITLIQHRIDMVQLAIAGNKSFKLSRVDIDRIPPHYAVDTMRLLRENTPGADLIYLMGEDSLIDLPTWHKPAEFVNECSLIGIMRRPGTGCNFPELEALIPGIDRKLQFLDTPLIEISATLIRQRIMNGEPFRYYLNPNVYQLVKKRNLYKN